MRYITSLAASCILVASLFMGFLLYGNEAEAVKPNRPLQVPRLIPLAENVTIPPGGSFDSPLVDTANCGEISVFLGGQEGEEITVELQLSIWDGEGTVLILGIVQEQALFPGPDGKVSYFPGIVSPSVVVRFTNISSTTGHVLESASLFCSFNGGDIDPFNG